MNDRLKIIVSTLVAATMCIIDARAQCYATGTIACSAYFPAIFYTCGTRNDNLQSWIPSGGQSVDICSEEYPGALGCQNEATMTCNFTVTLNYCDDTSEQKAMSQPVTPKEDNGQGPCPPMTE
jgi:hypothetical protein